MTYMCEHCANPGEHYVRTDRSHLLCDDCLDVLEARCLDALEGDDDWQPVEEQTR